MTAPRVNRWPTVARKAAVLGLALAACQSTRLTHVQVAPESPRPKVSNVLVVGLVKDAAARASFEAEFVKALGAAGVRAQASESLLPIGQAPTREALERLVREHGFDAALVGFVEDSRTEVRSVAPTPYPGGFYGYAGWAGPIAYSPGYLETTKTIVVETRLFRTVGEAAAVFTATSESVDPHSVTEVTQPLAAHVLAELKKHAFV